MQCVPHALRNVLQLGRGNVETKPHATPAPLPLLQAHGISAAGPNCILHNLHKLLLAAQSALPHLPPALGAATAALR